MNTFPKVGIITLNWNNCDDTIECVESLLKQDYPTFQIFVVENGSGDDSAERLETWGLKEHPECFISLGQDEAKGQFIEHAIVLLKSVENLGFSGGNNLACKIAGESGAKFFWFINNDTVHDEKALSALVETMQNAHRAGMTCSKVLYFNNSNVIESLGATLIVPFGIFRHIGQGTIDNSEDAAPVEVPYIYGCSFLASLELIREVGLLDESYFILMEESDWSIRARRKGWKLYCSPASRVWHKVSATIGKRSGVFFYYVARNTLLFMQRHYYIFLPSAFVVSLALVLGLISYDSLLSKRTFWGRSKMALLGYAHFFSGKRGKAI
ncbi:MAG: glycosyltransferase family 2 protein [Nitrospirae bacterium]|nr:glycosyltransferase family 2 protein [Nitrospirota bacterium]